jgi:hypothetical protein
MSIENVFLPRESLSHTQQHSGKAEKSLLWVLMHWFCWGGGHGDLFVHKHLYTGAECTLFSGVNQQHELAVRRMNLELGVPNLSVTCW